MAICCVVRPPHHLGGVAKSRSLFVATPPLILPRVKHGAGLLQRTSKYASGRLTNSSAWQYVAPYSSRRHSQDCLPDRQVKSAAGALQLALFKQPGKDDFLSSLLDFAAIRFGIP